MSFPEAWDRFTGVHGRYITRPATQDEVLHLRMQLEQSLEARGSLDTNGFAEAIAEHKATETGLDWLFEETLVLPEDFGREPEPEYELEAEAFDFSAEPVVLPAGRERRSVLK